MKGFNDIKWFWIIYCVIFLALGWSMASCNDTADADATAPSQNHIEHHNQGLEDTAMHGDTHSYTQLIDLDLNVVRVDQQHKVTARQIFYDIGSEPSKAGYVSVKINSTQSAPISMTPGGEINFDGIEEIYVSNTVQSGKFVRLLANNNATIKNPPNNPLTAGFDRTVDFTAFSNFHFYNDYLDGQFLNQTIVSQASNIKGAILHYLDGTVVFNDYRNSVVFTVTSPAQVVSLMSLRGSQRELIKNIYLKPGSGLAVKNEGSTSGMPVATFIGTLGLSFSGVIEYL